MAITALGVGSGLDLTGLLEGLREAERQKLVPLVQQKQSYQTKISAYGSVKSMVSSLQDALQKLGDTKFYASTNSSVRGDALNAAAGSGAAVGSYAIDVQQLAQAYSIATEAVTDKAEPLSSGAGSVRIELNNGHSFEVSVTEDKSSLDDIRQAINDADEGVRASIVNDGNGYRLVLASTETGTEAAIAAEDDANGERSVKVEFLNGLSGLALDLDTEMKAQNAELTINNIAVTSQSNQVEGALEGITLSLVKEGSATLDVQIDNDGIKEVINNFVDTYNSFQNHMRSLTSYNASAEVGGLLQGDTTTRIMQNALRGALSGGDFGTLSDVGISLELNGNLKVDEEKLDGLVGSELSKIVGFFAGDDGQGFVSQVNDVLDDFAKSGGRLEKAAEGLETSISHLDDRFFRMERSIEATLERYRRQFVQLDSMIASMNATSSYLNQQFDMLNAQMGRKK